MSARDENLEKLMLGIEARVASTLRRLDLPQLRPLIHDIAQDVRLRVWKVLGGKSEIRFLPSYLQRVVVTSTIDAIRHFKAQKNRPVTDSTAPEDHQLPEPTSQAAATSPDARAHQQGLVDMIESRLSRLPRETQQVVRLHVQGFSTREIGDLLGGTEPRIRNLLYRTLPLLRKGLDAEEITYED